MSKFSTGLTDSQARLARTFEREGITSYSQAVKAFTRRDNEQIDEWKKQLQEKQNKKEN